MAPAEKGSTSLKKTSATVRSAPFTTKLRSSTQEDHQAETNNVMFSRLLEALQATTSQMVALTDRIANLEMQQTSTPIMSDTLNTILQRLDHLEQENQLMRKLIETKTSVSADLTSINNNKPATPALQTDSSASKYATSTNVIDPPPETSTLPTASTPQVLPTAPATKPPTYSRSRRNFTEPSSNPGFTYLYLPTRARMPFKEVRNSLRDLSFNSGSIVDIHYVGNLWNLLTPLQLLVVRVQ